MENAQIIQIQLPEKKARKSDASNKKFEELVARFCYAAATLPRDHVVSFLDLLETCAESDTIPSTAGTKSGQEH